MLARVNLNILRSLNIGGSLILASKLPSEDYPPANINKMIKECEAVGRKDLGQQLMAQWNKTVVKYPKVRLNWPAATVIGTNSIKKNVFGGQEFSEWLGSQVQLAPDQKKAARAIPAIEHVSAPAIAIPEEHETPEEWQAEAHKTKALLDEGEKAFSNVQQFVDYLKKESADLSRKLEEYGPGGSKEKTKTGQPSKFADRVPKWKAQLSAYSEKLSAIDQVHGKFKAAKKQYEEAPVTTKKYEEKVQHANAEMLKIILNMDDLEAQKDMLEKFAKALENAKKETASVSVDADFWGFISGIFDHLMAGWKSLVTWFHGLFKAVDEFEQLANIRY
jgi:hypothetical protein